MKQLFRLAANTFVGYGFVLNQFTLQCLESTSHRGEKHMLVAEKFLRSLVEKYGRHTVFTLMVVHGTMKHAI